MHEKICTKCDAKKKLILFDKNPGTNDKRGSWCKKCCRDYKRGKYRNIKNNLVILFGGKCIVCGYNKCIAALQFHHRQRETKCFELSSKWLHKSWEVLVTEASKCDLVCANCHAEIEYISEKCE